MPPEPKRCPDCNVLPGAFHREHCDVARCQICGWQMLGCRHSDLPTRWRGTWPGEKEVSEGLAEDLNDLYQRAAAGRLVWDVGRERWVLAWVDA